MTNIEHQLMSFLRKIDILRAQLIKLANSTSNDHLTRKKLKAALRQLEAVYRCISEAGNELKRNLTKRSTGLVIENGFGAHDNGLGAHENDNQDWKVEGKKEEDSTDVVYDQSLDVEKEIDSAEVSAEASIYSDNQDIFPIPALPSSHNQIQLENAIDIKPETLSDNHSNIDPVTGNANGWSFESVPLQEQTPNKIFAPDLSSETSVPERSKRQSKRLDSYVDEEVEGWQELDPEEFVDLPKSVKKSCRERPKKKISSKEKKSRGPRGRYKTNRKLKNFENKPNCKICNLVLSGPTMAVRHMTMFHVERSIECPVCDEACVDEQDLSLHVFRNHFTTRIWLKNRLACKECGLEICDRQSISHMKSEHGKEQECPFCSYGSAIDPKDLHVDILLQSSSLLITPEVKLKRHIKTHFTRMRIPRCHACYKTFDDKETLAEHLNPNFEGERRTEICKKFTEEKEKSVCTICGLSFTTTYLSHHMRRMHDRENSFYKYGCHFCDRRFEHPKRLRAHLLQVHMPDKKDYECNLCHKKYASARMLKSHEATHFSPTIKCSKCDKLFKTRNNLKQHFMSHLPPQYECLACHKKFVYRCGLKTHLIQVHKYENWEMFMHKASLDEQEQFLQTNTSLLTDFS